MPPKLRPVCDPPVVLGKKKYANSFIDVASMQLPDGSFQGDEYGEVDSRFVFSAIQTLSLLDKLDLIDTDKCTSWILKCQNFDGGFGLVPGAESHAAQSTFKKKHLYLVFFVTFSN